MLYQHQEGRIVLSLRGLHHGMFFSMLVCECNTNSECPR